MTFSDLWNPEKWREFWSLLPEFPGAIWETLYATVLSTFFAILIGLPVGILLFAGEKDGVLPLPKWLMAIINFIVNLLRSVPFIILVIVLIPLTRVVMGTSIGTFASVFPLVIAAFPFIARLVESSLREVDPNLIEMAESMGASPWQIIFRVLLPESVPSLISNFTIAITTILGYTAMSAAFGGGGLGFLAINYGYYRYKYIVMLAAVLVLVLLVVVFQEIGKTLAKKADKRLKK